MMEEEAKGEDGAISGEALGCSEMCREEVNEFQFTTRSQLVTAIEQSIYDIPNTLVALPYTYIKYSI
jgi:hypothetical protein